jgi:DUF2075 family protein
MIIYDNTKAGFMSDVVDQKIAIEIEKTIYDKMHRKTGLPEFHSWENSLQFVTMALYASRIPDDAGVAIEYNIPQTSKRVDVIVSGYDRNQKAAAIIIELKQWEEIRAVPGMDAVVDTWTGGAERRVAHPSYQAWSYAALIKDYNQTVQKEDIGLYPCAFLHNYIRKDSDDPLDEAQYALYEEDAPAFAKGDARKLGSFIAKHIKTGDNRDVIYRIDHGKLKPSKSLQDSIAGMVKGKQEFVMIDEQKVVYETILDLSRKCHDKKDHKRTIIVKGGPGTGKTVVAINLLAALTAGNDQFVQYATKNSAPRQVYLRKLKGQVKKSTVDNMFKNSDAYYDAPLNAVDTILVDEAHRLREKSGMFGNKGENQIREIIHASRCSVFFIDEEQRVTTQDIGSVAEIKKQAFEEHSEVTEMELVSQFRCNGSDGYLSWIDNTLQIRDTANFSLKDADYDFRVCDTPEEMRDLIYAKNRINHKSRILAGYCWEWPKAERNNPDYHDIQIGDFEMSWNFQNGIWAIDPDSVKEAGCIHTSQGLEFDYVGVIIGDDMRCENDHIITDFTRRAKTDQSVKGLKGMMKKDPEAALKEADEIIKNTYRTLMTRGMKGCYVYCTDHHLSEYLKKRM